VQVQSLLLLLVQVPSLLLAQRRLLTVQQFQLVDLLKPVFQILVQLLLLRLFQILVQKLLHLFQILVQKLVHLFLFPHRLESQLLELVR